jgi:glycosyltransferase involved in cell wall biosynthesis
MPPHSIAHIITELDTGGAEMMLLKLLAGTDREHWLPRVLSLRDRGTLGERMERLRVPVASLGVRGVVPGLGVLLRLRRELRAATPSLIQGWMYHGNLAALAARALSPGRPPVVWSIRNTVYDFGAEKKSTAGFVRLGALLSSRVARIVYNSRTGARQHAELGYATRGALIIPNGFDTETFRPSASARAAFRRRLGVGDNGVLIGRIGRYHPMKDYPTFLKAAALLSRDRPHVRFVLAGHDVDRANGELTGMLESLALGNVVKVLGEVASVHELMAALDIACSSSSYGEGFPNVVGEAMACGVPCVATDVGDEAWIVGDTGRVTPPGDPEALAMACRVLVDAGTDARRLLGAAARTRVIEEFSLGRVVSEYEGLYADLLEAGGNG